MNLGIQGLRIEKIPKSLNSLIPKFYLLFQHSKVNEREGVFHDWIVDKENCGK
jgi:hypothetical protein